MYSHQLYKRGHGLPLYEPDREVYVGDVGFIRNSAFTRLFNAFLPADHPVQDSGVPTDFVHLDVPGRLRSIRLKHFDATVHQSRTVQVINVDAQLTSAVAPMGAGIKFECSNDLGAVLIMKTKATREDVEQDNNLVRDYVRRNVKSWYEFAARLSYQLVEGDLVLVSGCDRTAEWATAVFTERKRNMVIFLKGGYVTAGDVAVSVSGSWEGLSSAEHRSGPDPDQRWIGAPGRSDRPSDRFWSSADASFSVSTSQERSASLSPYPYDQCIYLRVWRFRRSRSLWPFRLKAAAEPKEDSPDREGDDRADAVEASGESGSDSSFEFMSEENPFIHPLDGLLDDLLKLPKAQFAIASDADLISLCQGREIPDDTSELLLTPSPVVRIDGEGTASIHCPRGPQRNVIGYLNSESYASRQTDSVPASLVKRIGPPATKILSWTSQDPRQSLLFNDWGTMYRFETDVVGGQPITTVIKQSRPNKEEKLEWALNGPNGGLGRAMIGESTMPMSDLVRQDALVYNCRVFTGTDAAQYRWRPSGLDVVLQDPQGNVIAFVRPTRPTRCKQGEVHAELHFIPSAGTGIVMHPPMMDIVTVTAMMYRFVTTHGL